MDEGTLGVHQIEFMIDAGEHLSDRSRIRDHADCTHNLSKITTRDNSWWLVVDTTLESSWTPVNELDGTLGLDGSDSSVHILWHDVTTVHHAARHVLTVTRIALNHHRGWFEHGVGDLSNGELLVVGLLGGDDWSIGRKHEMDSWVWHQVGLELSDIDVKSTVESEGSGKGGDDLSDESVKVGVGWSLDIEVSSADIINGFVIDHDGDIGVLEEGVSGEDGVVWLNNGG